MSFSRRFRKVALTAHVVFSVGWLGSVLCFMILSIIGLTHQDEHVVRAVYIPVELIASLVIVPLCMASLMTGILLSLGTEWGLFKHYWILIKLLVTVLSTLVLLIHMQPIRLMADAAADLAVPVGDYHQFQIQLLVASAASLLVLLFNTTLSIFKPRGLTPYGWRKLKEQQKG